MQTGGQLIKKYYVEAINHFLRVWRIHLYQHLPAQQDVVHNIYCKTMTTMIVTFLQTAAHPLFLRSVYHSWLFRFCVLEKELPNPGFLLRQKHHQEGAQHPCP